MVPPLFNPVASKAARMPGKRFAAQCTTLCTRTAVRITCELGR